MKVGNWRWALGMVAVSTVLGAGCAQEVGDIDRTNPDKLEKSLFDNDDEWYFRQTVVDTDFQGSMGYFAGLESGMKRVRWVITEDTLYAMSTVEPAEGVTAGYYDDETRRVGVVAAFPILSHFDVQRAYNASTGEQSNVISENGSDRNWWERKYMRVDWSRNLADGMQMFGNELGALAASTYELPQDDDYVDPNRTRISDDYIDTVTAYFYEPDIYACYNTFGYDSIYNCEGGELRMRNSFLKVPKTKTYQPLEYLDTMYIRDDDNVTPMKTMSLYDPAVGQFRFEMECDDEAKQFDQQLFGYSTNDACQQATFDMFSRFGFFRTERVTWDEEYGSSKEDQRRYYANRWNIWETVYGEDGKLLDMKDRQPKPIIYHLNLEFPEDMFDESQEVARQWNEAFIQTVTLAKGQSRADLEADLQARYNSPKMYEIRRNSCSGEVLETYHSANPSMGSDSFDELMATSGKSTVKEAFNGLSNQNKALFCATLEFKTEGSQAPFTYERVGDLRYSFFNWVEHEVPWLCYGPSAADPLTGQIISGNANFNGTAIRTYGPISADYVQYANGDLAEEEIKTGDEYRRELAQRRTAQQPLSPEAKREMAVRSGLQPNVDIPTRFERKPTIEELPKFFKKLGPKGLDAVAARASESAELQKSSDTRALEFFAQPEVRQLLLQDQDFRLVVEAEAAQQFGPLFTDDDFNNAYLDMVAPKSSFDRYQRRNNYLSSRNIMSLESLDEMITNIVTYAGVADYFKGKSRREISDYFVSKMFVGTQLHEVGHTVGLRHNFQASTDALNYHDTYWEIQEAIADGIISDADRWSVPANVAGQISDVSKLGDKGVDVGYLSEAEFRLASVMDYTGDFTGRFAGLGKYDQAAINFAYAEMVEEWSTDAEYPELRPGYDLGLFLDDYRQLPAVMVGVDNPTTEQVKQGIDRIINGRTYKPIAQVIEEYRAGLKTNRSNWVNGSLTAPYINRTVPYAFCSDEYNGSSLNCSVFDWGANQTEIVNHQFNTYRMFNLYRRYNRGGIYKLYENVNNYANWVASIFDAANVPFRYYSYYQWYDFGDYTDDLRSAAIDTLNFFTEVLAMPEPQRYCMYNAQTSEVNSYWFYDLTDVYVPASWDRNGGACTNYIDIEQGAGQPYNYDFTNEYDYRIRIVGSNVDKAVATQMLFGISGNFLRSEFITDFRATNISYWTLFRPELYNLLRGFIVGDYEGVSGVYNPQTSSYAAPVLVDRANFGTGAPNPQNNMRRVYVPISFNNRFNMLAYSFIYNNTWSDRDVDFGQYAKVCVGYTECQDLDPSIQVKEFIHPVTGQIYQAPIPNGGESISGDLVDQVNVLKARYVEAKNSS
ncbi:MAG: zinc-dependent metalloprotease [bacterium]